MFADVNTFQEECSRYLDMEESVIRGIRDEELLRESFIDVLARNAVFNQNVAIRKECRILIRALASYTGIHSRLLENQPERVVFHLPGFTYQWARVLFERLPADMPRAFGWSESEMQQTGQSFCSYSAMIYAAAIKSHWQGDIFLFAGPVQTDDPESLEKIFKHTVNGEYRHLDLITRDAAHAFQQIRGLEGARFRLALGTRGFSEIDIPVQRAVFFADDPVPSESQEPNITRVLHTDRQLDKEQYSHYHEIHDHTPVKKLLNDPAFPAHLRTLLNQSDLSWREHSLEIQGAVETHEPELRQAFLNSVIHLLKLKQN